ncbi:MAG: pseudouridine synthase [Sediminibacterium sp.]|nr:pseudouridine synthase [Sediminibacterium sp.]
MHQYYLFYKPFQVLSTFTSSDGKQCLRDYIHVDKDVYAAGRLDYDSEGLLLLTNDGALMHQLLDPAFYHSRTYYVQVEGVPDEVALQSLRSGVDIRVDGKVYHTLPAKVVAISEPANLPDRNPPIRFRKTIPASWLSITLQEGKNRQVRKMTAAVGYPTLRLIRWSIENITVDQLQPGQLKEISRNTLLKKLLMQP